MSAGMSLGPVDDGLAWAVHGGLDPGVGDRNPKGDPASQGISRI